MFLVYNPLKMASPFFRGSRGRFERGLMVPGAVWAVTVAVWVVASSICAVTAFTWTVTSSMSDDKASMHDMQVLCE